MSGDRLSRTKRKTVKMMSPESGFSTRRIMVVTAILSILGGLAWGLYRNSVASGLSLTGTGVLAIINFSWLESILSRVLRRVPPRLDAGVVLRLGGRMLVLGLLLAALLLIPSVDGVGVALGYSSLVVAVIFEGMRT